MVDHRKKLHTRDKKVIPIPKLTGWMADKRVGPGFSTWQNLAASVIIVLFLSRTTETHCQDLIRLVPLTYQIFLM